VRAESLAKRRATILARRTRNAAYHEAAHAVVALRLGFSVSSCWLCVADEPMALGHNPMDGRTQYFRRSGDGALTFTDPDGHDEVLVELATQEVQARLDQANAAFRQAELDFNRTANLRKQNAATQAELDAAQARFETAKVDGITRVDARDALHVVRTDRGDLSAALVVDALGWRRVLATEGYQPPEAPLSRGLEVHPDGGGEHLDIWVDRSLVRRGYGWSVPAGGEQRVGVGSYDPHDHVKRPTIDLAERLEVDAVRYQGNWFPHRLRPATEDGVFFAGDSSGHCFPLSGEGIRTAFYFGIAAGRELRRVVAGDQDLAAALENYAAFSHGHRRPFARALQLQRLIPALPPRVLTLALKVIGSQRIVDRAFGWYLDQAHPDFATGPDHGATAPVAVARAA